jgi:ATP-binding cassette, subfamily A (ABC1), member 3
MSMVTAMFVMFYIRERVSRAKLLQFVSGANKVVYWLTSFAIDYALFILISIIFLMTLMTYQKDGFSTGEEIMRNFYLLAVFGFAVLPLTYLLSFFFKIPSNGVVLLAIGYIVTGVFMFLTYFTLNNPKLGLTDLAKSLGKFFLIFPHYSFTRGMSNLKMLSSQLGFCDQKCSFSKDCHQIGIENVCSMKDVQNIVLQGIKNACCDKSYYSFEETGIGRNLLSMTIVGILSFIVLFAVEYQWIQNIFFKIWKQEW